MGVFKTKKLQEVVVCKCGCKAILQKYDSKWRPRVYVRGHSMRGKKAPWVREQRKNVNIFLKKNNQPKIRATRWRARQLVKSRICGLLVIGGCGGRIEVNHIDKNPYNNSLQNLIPLCHSHHALTDRGKIDLNKPIMPRFYVDKSGKRRYEKSRYWNESK